MFAIRASLLLIDFILIPRGFVGILQPIDAIVNKLLKEIMRELYNIILTSFNATGIVHSIQKYCAIRKIRTS